MEAFEDHQQDLVLDSDADRKDVKFPQGISRTGKELENFDLPKMTFATKFLTH